VKFFDTFTGIGGFTITLFELGHECVGYSETDKYAVKIYESSRQLNANDSKGSLTTGRRESATRKDTSVSETP
jgi:DNA (cytosine-5)-methyltransferase 1